ncbi:hypothetical protein BJ165DRAFT_1531786 [Panaeolus papilionaceus]|nr:hypothetical protein BJ165DRAFT_1531786 [Panaeolus papilionaceus]
MSESTTLRRHMAVQQTEVTSHSDTAPTQPVPPAPDTNFLIGDSYLKRTRPNSSLRPPIISTVAAHATRGVYLRRRKQTQVEIMRILKEYVKALDEQLNSKVLAGKVCRILGRAAVGRLPELILTNILTKYEWRSVTLFCDLLQSRFSEQLHSPDTIAAPATLPPSPAVTPSILIDSESDVTPSRDPNSNGKPPMTTKPPGGARRTRDHRSSAVAAFTRWRFRIKEQHYLPGPFTAAAILPDPILNKLASHTTLQTLGDLESVYPDGWFLGHCHFDEAMEVLSRVNHQHII